MGAGLDGIIFDDLEWPLTPISRSRYFSTLNISETTRDRAIVTIEHQQEVVCALSTGDISNDLEWPLTRVSRSQDTYKSNISKRCVLGTKLLKNTNRKPYTIYRMVQRSMTSDPDFKVTTFIDIEYIRNDTSYYRTSIGSHMRSIAWWHFQ